MATSIAAWTACVALIFGGCCSNVYTLETIIRDQPGSGLLITFVQFIVTALFTWVSSLAIHLLLFPSMLILHESGYSQLKYQYPSHVDATRPPFFLKPMAIPLVRWLPNIVMFFAVNLLNNMAFGYNISVPVHIILRSGGSVLTMLVGFTWGKRYTSMQVFSIVTLTVGVIIAAMADAQAKGKIESASSPLELDREKAVGLSLLFIAQLLSAIMGLYVQLTYAAYGSHWSENLFYSHLLSIPLFLPFGSDLLVQAQKLQSDSRILLAPVLAELSNDTSSPTNNQRLPPIMSSPLVSGFAVSPQILNLALNALTQYACIRGVNMLAARTSAIGVTVVLNTRKLASLLISIYLFGNQLPLEVVCGAAIVFSSAGLWGWESQRIGNQRKLAEDSKKMQ